MTIPVLENIVGALNYADLPDSWEVPDIHRFSRTKTLYDYQADALHNAARALFLYYGQEERDWKSGEPQEADDGRKSHLASLYGWHSCDLSSFNIQAGAANHGQSTPVFRILAEHFNATDNAIPYHNLINRMCFWMATGSGKTLVMVKLIEYLHSLIRNDEIPPNNILLLAPSDHLLDQIRHTIDEFNQTGGLQIDLQPLRQAGRASHQHSLSGAITVYYHRSDNISDEQKEVLTDYRTYENGGKWYVFLDEAHKGGKEDSKRQAYYAVMARAGFLFNFSATFTDAEDIVTTVKKYNLQEFTGNGYGKNIYLNESEYSAFRQRDEELNHDERRKIILKSLATLAYTALRVDEVRQKAGLQLAYHQPLMMTLVNSVSTDVDKNDLWAFFQMLREIASGEIDDSLFADVKAELLDEWEQTSQLFGDANGEPIGVDANVLRKMRITDVREKIFLSRTKSVLQCIRSSDNKELAFQMKNSDSPFALIRIGDTSKWRTELLQGYEETETFEKSFFENLNRERPGKKLITILMGSRTFFESWDSNRPNVVNFINIGGQHARKFVVQSIGRGVRIEPLKDKRRRLKYLLSTLEEEKARLSSCHDRASHPETLFVFATNRGAVKSVLEGLKAEKEDGFEKIDELSLFERPQINGKPMPLLVPVYREASNPQVTREQFSMSEQTIERFKRWLEATSDSVLAVRDNLSAKKISELRKFEERQYVTAQGGMNHRRLSSLQGRLISYLSKAVEEVDGVREMSNEDIVHFREILVHSEYAADVKERIERVRAGTPSGERALQLARQFADGTITPEEFRAGSSGTDEEIFKEELHIRKILQHYYFPVLTGDEKLNYVKHIVKIKSEVDFLGALEAWVDNNLVGWDAWMFSKIDESLDKIRIPYFEANRYRDFHPDFIFWMCKENDYRIVFVDPKGTTFTSAEKKIDGYANLFKKSGRPRKFEYGRRGLKVQVDLLMFNDPSQAGELYRSYWTNDPARIFADACQPR